MTENEILSSANFEYIVFQIPKNTVKLILDCMVLNEDKTQTVRGSFDPEAIREIRNDYIDLTDITEKNSGIDENSLFVVASIPKNIFKLEATFSIFNNDGITLKHQIYDMEDIRKMRNNYLELDPEDSFFSFWELSEDLKTNQND